MSEIFHAIHKDFCTICGGKNLIRYLSLGDQPPSNSFITPAAIAAEQRFPLDVYLCTDCGLSQLLDIIAAEDIFRDYAYRSSSSRALCQHYQEMIDDILIVAKPASGSLAVDIGCNDGITLNCYPAGTCQPLGVDPSSAGQDARDRGFDVLDRYFNKQSALDIFQRYGPAKIITATNVVTKIDDINDMAAGIHALLDDEGVFVIEFPYLVDMIEMLYFDTIYHEHYTYLSLTPLDVLLGNAGLRAFRVSRTDVGASGPALRLYVCKQGASFEEQQNIIDLRAAETAWGIKQIETYQRFAGRVQETGETLVAMLTELKANGAKIAAYGAPAKGNTLLNLIRADTSMIDVVAENNDLKIGKVTPGTHIPIVSDEAFMAGGYTHALLLAWNYLDFFLQKSPYIKTGGTFIVPVPKPTLLP